MLVRNRKLVKYIFLILVFLLSLHQGYSQVSIYSNGNGGGDWSDTLSWAGYVIPGISDTAVVLTNDTITVDSSDYSVGGLTIESAALVLHNNNRLSIYGNYLNNGQHVAYGGNRIYFRGVGTTIDGTGIVYNTGLIRVYDGDKTFPASASLTFGPSEVRVWTGLTMHNYGNLDFIGRINGYAGSTWINEANSRVDVGYDIFISATLVASSTGNTINYYRNATFDITRTSDSSYYNLEISGGGLKRLTGQTTILGDLDITARLTTQKWAVDLKGNYTNSSTITSDSSIISFTGTSDQTINNAAGETFYGFRVNKTSGNLFFDGNLTITDTLWMNSGDINLGSGLLTLGSSTGEGTLLHTSGRIIGMFKRWITSTGTDILLPAGNGSNDYPVIVNFTNLTPGTLSTVFTGTNPGTNGLPLIEGTDTIYNVFTEGYWDLTAAEGLSSTDYDIQLAGIGFSSFDTDSSRILKRSSAGAQWILDGTHVQASGDTARRTGMSGFSQFVFGAPDSCDAPVTAAIVGSNSVCINVGTVPYQVSNTPGSSYAWTITGGNQSGGGLTNSITVDWDGTGMQGQVQVIETNACASGVPVTLDVNIHPLPTSDIAGPPSVPEGAGGMEYSVTSQVGYTYAWIISGGTLVSGDGTNEVIINWGSAGSGSVQVTSTHSCGSATPVVLNVEKYSGIKSILTGDWDNPSTWDCTCIPANTDNVIISSGDSVYLVAGTYTVQNLHVDSGAVLYQPNLNIYVQGNYRIDGEHAGVAGGENIYLDGIDTEISGTGTISNATGLQMRYGNKTIPAGTRLTKQGSYAYVAGDVIVTNYGEVTFTYRLYAANSTSVWINEEGSSLNAGGNGTNPIMWRGVLVASADNNTVAIISDETQNVKVPQSNTYYNLIIGGGYTKSLIDNITVKGDMNISSLLNAGSYSINLAGDWDNTGVFNEGTGSVVIDGSGDQSITNSNSETLYDLQVIKSGGELNLSNDVTVSNALDLDGGNIVTGFGKLTIGTSLGNTGTLNQSSGHIIGDLERWVAATGTDILFAVGTSQWYRPVQANFNALSGGSLIARFEESTPGSSGLPISDGPVTVNNTHSEGYWKLTTANSLVSSDFNLDVIANGFTSFSIIPDSRLLSRSSSAGEWTTTGSHVAADVYTVSRDNVSILSGDYAVGDTMNCSPPVTTGFSGSTSVCQNATGESYSVCLLYTS
ncbi:MAG TPA: hypothetical protein ENI20_11760, partial [Bacteroides sp.]|nr:hypothetical protein [Bacteroides sp.]